MRKRPVKYELHPGVARVAFAAAQKRLQDIRFTERLIARDPAIFKADPAHQKVITNRLGWLDSYATMRNAIPELTGFIEEVISAGINQLVIIGMGGSSLCPEVLGKVFGLPAHLETYVVLDSTAPKAVRTVMAMIDPQRTLFVVASKSGTTVETRSHADFFFARQKDHTANPGAHFAAITDAGSVLEKWGSEMNFRRVFLNPSDIGGRFSALSYFGLVPAALLGIDLKALLNTVDAAAQDECTGGPAQELGAFLYACYQQGRDKITFLPSPQTAPLVPWIEQLLAESTGKEGRGIFPIEGEPLGSAEVYGADRAFITMRFAAESKSDSDALVAELKASGIPVADISLENPSGLGAAFLQWEWTTAAVGCLLGVNPFDEPNVTESKNNTARLLGEFERSGSFQQWPEIASGETFSLCTRSPEFAGGRDATRVFTVWLAAVQPGDYVALLAYLTADEELENVLAALRRAIRDRLRAATLRGWGPRFLHSIGQLYKGGPARGHFIVITHESDENLEIPGRPYTFGQLITGQALGDSEALADRSRPVLQVRLKGDIHAAMKSFEKHILPAIDAIGKDGTP